MSRRAWLILSFIVLGLLMLLVTVFSGSSVPENGVTVTYKNSRDVAIYDISESQDRGDREFIASITSSGQTIKLREDRGYAINYKGNDGYESGSIPFDASKSRKISIDPYYSENRLRTMLGDEVASLHQTIQNNYSNINLYQIQPGKLYHFGDWYGTTLRYAGQDPLNSDTLRVVLHKESGVWIIKTDPPNISLSKYAYPDIPKDVLSDLNNFSER
jgi:hypothetical protein